MIQKAILKLDNEDTDYIIFSDGQIYSNKTNKYLAGNINNTGYKMVTLSHNKKKKAYPIHRLIALTFLDNPNNLPVVNHKDGNKLNNNISNLEWVSYSENKVHSDNVLKNINGAGKRNKIIIDVKNSSNWKQFENTNYYVSKEGEIYNIKTSILLKQTTTTSGYKRVSLRINGKSYNYQSHILVAKTWINNNYNKELIINHKDGNKQNNNINNLEIINKEENSLHSYYVLNKNTKPVLQYCKDGSIIEYPSLTKAAKENNATPSGILYAINHNSKTKNSFWKYK